VPQKNNDKEHDFEKDPIEAYIDGEWVTAEGTTLGSDNGIGAAAMLTVLESSELVHGPVEALFTVDEETGMTGAFALQPGFVKGDILLNLDSEHDGELYIGCAGGLDVNVIFSFEAEPIPPDHVSLLLKVNGLKGGHSGIDISLGRGNSNQVLFRILWNAQRSAGMRLCSAEGGNMRNAIPREAMAHVIVPSAMEKDFMALVKHEYIQIKAELAAIEPSLVIEVSGSESVSGVMPLNFQQMLVSSIYACPNGPIRMTDGIPDLVETSTNLSIVRSEGNHVIVNCLLRSSVDSAKEDLGNRMKALFEMAGAEVEFSGSYPGWKPNMDSLIKKIMVRVYRELFGKEPEIKAIHAGLECGIIGGTYPNLDMISFGPTIRHPHSPDEKVHIGSVARFWDFLVGILKQVPEKK
jgi:dipeptidase D